MLSRELIWFTFWLLLEFFFFIMRKRMRRTERDLLWIKNNFLGQGWVIFNFFSSSSFSPCCSLFHEMEGKGKERREREGRKTETTLIWCTMKIRDYNLYFWLITSANSGRSNYFTFSSLNLILSMHKFFHFFYFSLHKIIGRDKRWKSIRKLLRVLWEILGKCQWIQ